MCVQGLLIVCRLCLLAVSPLKLPALLLFGVSRTSRRLSTWRPFQPAVDHVVFFFFCFGAFFVAGGVGGSILIVELFCLFGLFMVSSVVCRRSLFGGWGDAVSVVRHLVIVVHFARQSGKRRPELACPREMLGKVSVAQTRSKHRPSDCVWDIIGRGSVLYQQHGASA